MYRLAMIALSFAMVSTSSALTNEEYFNIARIVSSPLFFNLEKAQAGYTDSAVMLRTEIAYQLLHNTYFSSTNIEQIRQDVFLKLDSCHSSMVELKKLDSNTIDFEGLAMKSLKASPGLFRQGSDGNLLAEDKQATNELIDKALNELIRTGINAYQASEARSSYQNSYQAARRAGRKLKDIVDSNNSAPRPVIYGIGIEANIGDAILVKLVKPNSPAEAAGMLAGDLILAVDSLNINDHNVEQVFKKIPGAYKSQVEIKIKRDEQIKTLQIQRTVEIFEASLLNIDIDGSWDAFYDSDYVTYTNISGVNLTNVTLAVKLVGRHGANAAQNGDEHLHFIDKWPAGSSLVARYMSSSASGIATNESVDQIDKLEYKLYSDQFKQKNSIPYTGEAYNDDIKRYFGDSEFIGTWRNYPPDHLFHNSGFEVSRRDGKNFRVYRVNITAWQKNESRSLEFSTNNNSFEGKQYFRDKLFNNWYPDRIVMNIKFPYSNFVVEKEWDSKE